VPYEINLESGQPHGAPKCQINRQRQRARLSPEAHVANIKLQRDLIRKLKGD
jgi:hypothetical protein